MEHVATATPSDAVSSIIGEARICSRRETGFTNFHAGKYMLAARAAQSASVRWSRTH